MIKAEQATNAGVEALTGFAFQRNCAIYLILDNYDFYKKSNYFVCIEHHDDLIFAHLDDKDVLKEIKAFQAKKSSIEWTTNVKLAEIIAKMTNVGKKLSSEDYKKSDHYTHKLTFLTNNIIKLSCKKRTSGQVVRLKESNNSVSFRELHSDIQNNLNDKMGDYSPSLPQLDNVGFLYLDFASTDKSQKEHLTGKLANLFQGKIADPSAAMTLILSLFHNVETIYNQRNTAKLLDISKRIYGSEIHKAFNVITTRMKTYSFWRKNANSICESLNISVSKSRRHEEYIDNSFDYFKDLKEVEFQKIKHFVDGNRDVDDMYVKEAECILELHKRYMMNNQTQLDSEIVLFAIIAAYVETRDLE